MADEAPGPDRFVREVLANPYNATILARWRELDLPDGWLVAGCLFQTVWNLRDGKPPDAGIRDYDLFYFDPDGDEADEARVQARVDAVLADLGIVAEATNQARVHQWYPAYFGHPYPRLARASDGIDRFLVPCTAVGLRPAAASPPPIDRQLAADGWEVYAPYGLGELYAGILRPNPILDHRTLFLAKARSYRSRWPWLRLAGLSTAPATELPTWPPAGSPTGSR